MKLTGWYPEKIKPVRIGVYQTKTPWLGEGYSYWSGTAWSNQAVSRRRSEMRMRGGIQEKEWRGLASKDGK